MRYATAASSVERDAQNVSYPAGELHAWLPGQNSTVCGVQLSRGQLRGFAHVPWAEFTAPGTEVGESVEVCRRCLAATAGAAKRRRRHIDPRP
jgi:hypothetical protein